MPTLCSFEQFSIVLREDELHEIVVPFRIVLETLGGSTATSIFAPEQSKLSFSSTEERDAHLKLYIEKNREDSHLDYASASLFVSYDRNYFYRNLTKCLIAALLANDHLHTQYRVDRILDIGSGVGTFSLAMSFFRRFNGLEYLLVDSGDVQLDIARQLLDKFTITNASFAKTFASLMVHKRGLRISSYWLCSNQQAVEQLSHRDLRALLRDGMVVIDYRKNLERFANRIKTLSNVRVLELKCMLPQVIADTIDDRAISVHLLLASPPAH